MADFQAATDRLQSAAQNAISELRDLATRVGQALDADVVTNKLNEVSQTLEDAVAEVQNAGPATPAEQPPGQ